MKKLTYLTLVLLVAILSGCGPSREKSASNIDGLEKRLFSPMSTGFDQAKADSLLAAYELFVKRFPDDSLSLKFSFKAANLAMNLNNSAKAIELFDKFMEKYPDNPKASVSMFFKAYIYENQLKNLDKAKELYLQFVEKYPNSDFANDARVAMENLGKSPEQMVREFEAKQKADSIRVADSLAGLKLVKKTKKK
ncbi:MAG: tetratricopeptide repeat protein [Bacteroidetes bacterium]|nr:tetratricopeptide repeat protein [Bacteroidota bacterium]